MNQPSGWTHVVLNYIGPDNGQGIRIYHSGVLTMTEDTKTYFTPLSGHGRVAVGMDGDCGHGWVYAGVDMDELLFFNKMLSDQEIMDIKNMV